jgi:hypothetical protein
MHILGFGGFVKFLEDPLQIMVEIELGNRWYVCG